ncbi:MAG TPA: FecR domain-containing protein [Opitutaceae bacterium]|nr:FecR domain-containing protein [Opitutaceae bacterium]
MNPERPHSPSNQSDSDILSAQNALAWIRENGGATQVADTSRLRARRTRRRQALAGATAAALIVSASLVWMLRPSAHSHLVPDMPATAVLEAPEKKILADGSSVELKEGAKFEVDYRARERRIVLTDGEALFDVVSSPERPFIVNVGDIEVRALGTAFSVSVTEGEVTVLVTHGVVRVDQIAPTTTSPQPLATVGAKNRMVLSKTDATRTTALAPAEVAPVSEGEMAELLSWRVPRIEFSGTRLADVLPVFNRYSSVHLSLADSSLGDIQLSGSMRTDRITPLLTLLKNEFGIDAEPQGENAVILKRNFGNSP